MRILATLLCLISPAFGTQSDTQVFTRNNTWEWVGCYQLSTPADQSSDRCFRMPRNFQLLWKRLPSTPNSFELKALESTEYYWFSSWNPREDGQLEIHLGTGFVGCVLTLAGRGNTLSGTVQPWTDTDSPEHKPAPFPVEVRRVACTLTPHK
jgi:hypothetical protein